MSMQESLRTLAVSDSPPAPYGFEVFEQRRAMTLARRRSAVLGASGSIVALAFVSVIALLTQAPPQGQVGSALFSQAVAADSAAEPALVNLEQFDATTELQEYIAVLDAELSAARVQAAPAEQLRRLESTRRQLNDSLQRVSYAHSLLNQ